MPAPRPFVLTAAQRQELERTSRTDARAYLRERCAALLKLADGWSQRRVAQQGLLHPRRPETIAAWRTRYEAGGLAGLRQRPRRHWGPGPETLATVRAVVRQEPPPRAGSPVGRWRLADLQAAVPALVGYSRSGLSRLVRRAGLRLPRGRLRLHSPDPAYPQKCTQLAHLVALARRRPDRLGLWFGDEASVYRQPTLADRWFPVGDEPTAALSHASNTRHRLGAALDATSGQVVAISGSRLTVAELGRFLRTLRAADPDRLLVLVWDNWPVHAHSEVLAEATRLGIVLFWLPTYAPWLNPIEKLWRWLKQEVLHHHRLADDWASLKAACAAFLARFINPAPDLLRYVGLCPE